MLVQEFTRQPKFILEDMAHCKKRNSTVHSDLEHWQKKFFHVLIQTHQEIASKDTLELTFELIPVLLGLQVNVFVPQVSQAYATNS